MNAEQTALLRDFSAENVKDNYSKVAWLYDFWSWLMESKAAKRVIELAQIQDGEQILEVAVGTGSVFEEIVKRNKHGMNEGIDITPTMLSRAEKRLKRLDPDKKNFRLQIGNAYKLPFTDNTFDLVVNNFMLDLLPENDFVNILSEFNRVLKPSGRVVISNMAFGKKWYNKIWHWIAKLPSILGGCRPISIYDYPVKAGFNNIDVEYFSQNTFAAEVLRAKKGITSAMT